MEEIVYTGKKIDLDKFPVTKKQQRVLDYVKSNPNCTPRDIKLSLGFSIVALATNPLASLWKKGLVKKFKHPTDNRLTIYR